MFWVTAAEIAFYGVAFFGLWGFLFGKMPGSSELSAGETRWNAFFLLAALAAGYFIRPNASSPSTLALARLGSTAAALVVSGVVMGVIKARPGRVPYDRCSRCGCRIFPEDVVIGVGARLVDAGHAETAALAVMILGFKCDKCGRKFCLDCLSKHSHRHAYGGAACLTCGGTLSGLPSYNLR